MDRISNHIDEDLIFVQTGLLSGSFELRSGDSVVGTLGLHNLFGMSASVETNDGRWRFERRGFLRKRVSVRSEDSGAQVAIFRETGWSHGGVIQMPDEQRIRVSANFWLTGFEFRTEDEVPLLRCSRSWGSFRRCARLRISPDATRVHDLGMLVMLAGYIIVMAARDRAARTG